MQLSTSAIYCLPDNELVRIGCEGLLNVDGKIIEAANAIMAQVLKRILRSALGDLATCDPWESSGIVCVGNVSEFTGVQETRARSVNGHLKFSKNLYFKPRVNGHLEWPEKVIQTHDDWGKWPLRDNGHLTGDNGHLD